MLRRYNTGYADGQYSLVAGHLDGEETFREAMVREAKEEAGITFTPDQLKVVHVMNRYQPSNSKHLRERIDIFLQAETWEGEPKNMEPHKCDDLDWFPIDNTPEKTMPFINHFLANFKQNNFYSEFDFEKLGKHQ